MTTKSDVQSEKTFGHQHSLPPLPVPDLTSTCEKYLQSLKPLLTQEQLNVSHQIVNEFLENKEENEPLQNFLLER